MKDVTLEEAKIRLEEIVGQLYPGEEVVITREGRPFARLMAIQGERPQPVPGRGKGMLIIHSDDDEHLKDFAEYMP